MSVEITESYVSECEVFGTRRRFVFFGSSISSNGRENGGQRKKSKAMPGHRTPRKAQKSQLSDVGTVQCR